VVKWRGLIIIDFVNKFMPHTLILSFILILAIILCYCHQCRSAEIMVDKMMLKAAFCGCCSLRTGSVILGVLWLVSI